MKTLNYGRVRLTDKGKEKYPNLVGDQLLYDDDDELGAVVYHNPVLDDMIIFDNKMSIVGYQYLENFDD